MNKSKIVFAGGKPLGWKILKFLIDIESVELVVANPSESKGKSWFPKIKELTRANKLRYIAGDINKIEEEIRVIAPDFIICAYYDVIFKEKIINLAKVDSINIHLALSQDYLGNYPVNYAIIDGKKYAGVTIHSMTRDVDFGPVYAQSKVRISKDDTAKKLYFKCVDSAEKLFIKIWPRIKKGILKPKPIDVKKAVYHARSEFPSNEINMKWPKSKINRYVRALTFPPFPRPYYVKNDKKTEIIFPEK